MDDVLTKKKNKISKKLLFAWPTKNISGSISYVLIGYITFYATNVMLLPPTQVGLVFLISKLFDGVTDLIAGVLIDKTNTKLGKARPYDLAMIGYWLFLVLLFSAPELGVNAGLVYLFVMYTITISVFQTLTACNEAPYMSNALTDKSHAVTLISVSSIISMFFTIAVSMVLPQLIVQIGTDRSGWSRIAIMLAVPCTIVGLVRFFVVKEVAASSLGATPKTSVKELLHLLFHNKYIILVAIIILLVNLGTSLIGGVGTYYNTYILGDFGLGSIFSLTLFSVVIVMIIAPALSKRFGLKPILQTVLIAGIVSSLARLIDVRSIPLQLVCSFISSAVFPAIIAFSGAMIIDCMDYGEWKNNKRVEGIIASAQSVTNKVGAAIGTAVLGLMMGFSRYDGALAEQTASANNMIIALSIIAPVIIYGAILVVYHFYDLEKMLPKIRSELTERNAKG